MTLARLAALAAGLSLACGSATYLGRARQADAELTRAERLGAKELAPYEYYFALEHLRQARKEAAEADYGTATRLAEEAFHGAEQAIQIVRRRRLDQRSAPSEAP